MLHASWTTFQAPRSSTSIGAFAPILPMTLAVHLALLCAACVVLNSTVRFGARFSTMQCFLSDLVDARLDSATATGGATAVLTPLSYAVHGAWYFSVAFTLLQITIAVRAGFAALHTVNVCVCSCLDSTTTLSRALSPSTPLAANVRCFIRHFRRIWIDRRRWDHRCIRIDRRIGIHRSIWIGLATGRS